VVSLAFDRVGSGPTLVLLHPLGADRRVWVPLIERMSDDRELLAVDLPGFGESPPLAQTPTPRALADAVAGWLSTLDLDGPPHVAGISLGGWVALELGLSRVTQTTTAIGAAGLWRQPLQPKPATARRLAGALSPVIGPLTATGVGRRLLLTNVVAHPERVPAADAAHLIRAWARAPGFAATDSAMRAGRFEDLKRIPGPVTLVWPEHDRLVRRPRSLPATVHNVQLADAGHIPVWDAPEELTSVMLAASDPALAGA
jgi:pimeloyl-ACP methyl ester carboxylesterase